MNVELKSPVGIELIIDWTKVTSHSSLPTKASTWNV